MFSLEDDYILVVDDSEDDLLTLQMFLETVGYRVSLAQSGKEVLEKIAESVPKLILLDVMMPCVNGYEVARLIRKECHFSVPIIPMRCFDEHVVKDVIETGANDLILKPLDFDELLQKISRYLNIKVY